MCGIAGIINLDGTLVDQAQLEALTNAIAHRGPDGAGIFTYRNVGLGHRRLSIIDLSDSASQPMMTSDRSIVLSFNGEIYNFQEKRKELEAKGHVFRSNSDTEVLLLLYKEYGSACVQHLRGMFAFAILDTKRNTLFLARDRVGKKPIHYFSNGKTFAFASEMKALRTLPGCPHEIDQESIFHYLTMMYMPAPLTGIAGIKKLPAAHTLTIDLSTGKETLHRYWALSYAIDRSKSIEDWESEILTVLQESVRLRMISDVPIGAFLSGGIDSATIVTLMSRLSDHPVKTFSIGTSVRTHNELPDAERIATMLGTDHHPIVVEPDIVTLLPELVHTYEHPYADPSAIPTFLLARETRSHVTVALNGDGGDENFAGYVRYPILRFSERYAQLPSLFHSFMHLGTSALHAAFQTTLTYRMKRFQHSIDAPWQERYLQYLSFFTHAEKESIFLSGKTAQFSETAQFYARLTYDARQRATDPLHKAISMDIDTYLADDLMPKVDYGTMAHGLEARSPFLDHELMELTARIPAEFKLRGRNKKYILKKILKDLLPAETLSRKKTGFRLPLDHWFRTDLRSFVHDRLHASDSPLWQMLDRSKTQQFISRYERNHVDYSDHVWAILWLDEWMRQYL